MSSEGSVTSTASRIRQFGLYRTIDARTDEFLRSSRRRQIRQGCACAAISTAITVTVVVVILILYEYAIAVEWSSVQNKKDVKRIPDVLLNQPMADRLDRSYLGLDQEYLEKMPLLINAMQENNYMDPTIEISDFLSRRKLMNTSVLKTTVKPNSKPVAVRRTSPRPFYFEYRHPVPLPFSKTHGSKSWFERYRNEERLKNIRQIIKYLENTINAKVGDMHAKPTEKQVAFTGVYIEPMLLSKGVESYKSDLHPASSNNIKIRHLNHLADPLFNFKPENPGDVNLLADDFFRFSPVATPSFTSKANDYPMFRQIPFQNRNCHGNKCKEKRIGNQYEKPQNSTTKPFSVMLNMYPIKTQAENVNHGAGTNKNSIDEIYLTTSRPLVHFKRKSNKNFRRIYTPYKRPRYLSNLINKNSKSNNSKEYDSSKDIKPSGSEMIVHVNLCNEPHTKNKTDENNSTSTAPVTQTNPYTSKAPIEFSTSQIEDYHVGSSGYIPVPNKVDNSLPKVTTMLNILDTTTEHWKTAKTLTTSVIKFDIQDAKVPNQYLGINNKVNKEDISRRNSMELLNRSSLLEEMNMNENINPDKMQLTTPRYTSVVNNTLIVKLRNNINNDKTDFTETNTDIPTTTAWSYVPQINGHYRSINQNSRNVNKWLDSHSEIDRKNRLQELVKGVRSYIPKYVEIKRNNSLSSNKADGDPTPKPENDEY